MMEGLDKTILLIAVMALIVILLIALLLYSETRRLKQCPNCGKQNCVPLDHKSNQTYRIWECSDGGFCRKEHGHISGHYPPHL